MIQLPWTNGHGEGQTLSPTTGGPSNNVQCVKLSLPLGLTATLPCSKSCKPMFLAQNAIFKIFSPLPQPGGRGIFFVDDVFNDKKH